MRFVYAMTFALEVFMFAGIAGCGSESAPEMSDAVVVDDHADHNHSGWWCSEHGVPEEECPLCDTTLVSSFKEKGDWCEEHSRPESQCFTCNPENFAKFASRYEAKFGEQPPTPTE